MWPHNTPKSAQCWVSQSYLSISLGDPVSDANQNKRCTLKWQGVILLKRSHYFIVDTSIMDLWFYHLKKNYFLENQEIDKRYIFYIPTNVAVSSLATLSSRL